MPRPIVDASTIARLRTLLIAHNESGVGEKAKLGDLKKVYTTGWTGEEKALARVQAHLEKLAKADFDESKHRRDNSGRFARGTLSRRRNDGGNLVARAGCSGGLPCPALRTNRRFAPRGTPSPAK